MQETEIDIINTEETGLIDKIKNWVYDNWQTILVVLIVLIVGMSAYNYNQNGGNSADESGAVLAGEDNNSSNGNENAANTDDANTENKDNNAEVSTETQDQAQAANEDSSVSTNSTTNTNTATVTSTIDDSGKKYTVTADRGDGITHLARKALGEYLKETGQGSDLTPEHKIYIEDYMQNRTGRQNISVGQQLSFSESLITDAISSAKTLSPKSLENLQKYIK